MSAIKNTKKEFGVHPSVIYTIITRQASGLPKALLELAMNSVDAGATEIDLTIDEQGFTFSDNGKGFKDLDEVEKYFGTYGTPREVESFYGKFRIGRSQIQAYSATKWFSRDFCMHVDLNIDINDPVRQDELGYMITLDHEFYQGCKIEGRFYKKQNVGHVNDVLENHSIPENSMLVIPAFKKMVKYLPVKIRINGKKVNFALDRQVAFEETDQAIYLLEACKQSELPCINVYNKGVYAYQIPTTNIKGDVVSLEKIDLNMARNQAKATCAVARHITRKINSISKVLDSKDSKKLNRAEKIGNLEAYIDDIWGAIFGLNEYSFNDIFPMLSRKVITSIDDKKHSVTDIISMFSYHSSHKHTIYNFQDCQNKIVPSSKDHMKLSAFYIPDTFLPSQAFLDRIVSTVTVNPKIFSYGIEYVGDKIESVLSKNDSTFFHFNPNNFNMLRSDIELQTYLTQILYILHTYSPKQIQNASNSALYIYGGMFKGLPQLDLSGLGEIKLNPLTVTLIQDINKHSYIQDTKLDRFERLVLRAINNSCWFIKNMRSDYEEGRTTDRKIKVKTFSDNDVLAYTDGKKEICFKDTFFREMLNEANFEYLIEVVLHEYSHSSHSLETLTHGATFNARFKFIYLENSFDKVEGFYREMLVIFNELMRKDELLDVVPMPVIVKVLKFQQDYYTSRYA